MERRKFIRNTISFSALISLHYKAQAASFTKREVGKNDECRFKEITLCTSRLKDQYEFYHEVLGFPVLSKDKGQFTLKIGQSTLQFKKAIEGSDPFYHFAINIPSNKYKEAKEWLEARTPLLKSAGSDQDLLYFDFWDAHAMYFKDPAGNIGELIARHTLDNDSDGEFGISDLLCISEIGTPVADPAQLATELKAKYDLDTYGEAMFIGDELGLYVAVPIQRLWFPEFTQKAAVFPTEICTNDPGPKEFIYQDYPYTIRQKK